MKTELFKARPYAGLTLLVIAVAAALLGGIGGWLAGFPGAVAAALVAALSGVGALWYLARKDAILARGRARQEEVTQEISADRMDQLTGLANMNGLNAWFAEKAARLAQDNKALIVLAADLANFNQLVRTRGEEQANAVLKEAAKRVSSFIGDDGIAARTDGDEFAAVATVVPSRSLELAAERAGKLAEMLQRPIEMPTGVIWIGGSVGAATGAPTDGPQVFERAKAALKKAKLVGQGHYYVDGVTEARE